MTPRLKLVSSSPRSSSVRAAGFHTSIRGGLNSAACTTLKMAVLAVGQAGACEGGLHDVWARPGHPPSNL